MSVNRESERRAVDAIGEAIRLIELAERSVNSAQIEFHGDLLELASRLSRHLRFLRNVAELVCHEIERQSSQQNGAVVALPSRSAQLSVDRLVLGMRR